MKKRIDDLLEKLKGLFFKLVKTIEGLINLVGLMLYILLINVAAIGGLIIRIIKKGWNLSEKWEEGIKRYGRNIDDN